MTHSLIFAHTRPRYSHTDAMPHCPSEGTRRQSEDASFLPQIPGCSLYGPADLIQVWKRGNTMRLTLQSPEGSRFEAVYRGCAYWRMDQQTEGLRFASVRQVTVRELLENSHSVSMLALHKTTHQVTQLLYDWQNAGLSFYLHQGKTSYLEFLVVCQSLELHPAD